MNSTKTIKIGVLAIIGSFVEHVNQIERVFEFLKKRSKGTFDFAGQVFAVRTPNEINDDLDGLIIPGGESTVLSSFLQVDNFAETVQKWTKNPAKVTWGTCAGLIILSNEIENGGRKPLLTIGGLDITCYRNGYGRQNHSHVDKLNIANEELRNSLNVFENSSGKFPGVFIRAPVIHSINSNTVEVLCSRDKLTVNPNADAVRLPDEKEPVGIAQGNLIATTFHPELTDDTRWHSYFISQIWKRKYGENLSNMFC